MKEIAKTIKSFDEEKKKKIFEDLMNAKSVESVMSVCNNYNLNITKEQAAEMLEELKGASKLTKEELSKMVSGGSFIGIFYCL